MLRLFTFCTLLIAALHAQAVHADEAATPSFAGLLEVFFRGYFAYVPTAAVNAGLHEYDGRLPDYSPEGVQAKRAWLEEMRVRTAAIDVEKLSAQEQMYRDYLAVVIATELFNMNTLKVQENNVWYGYLALDPDLYLTRDYAPLTLRMEAYIRHVEGIPQALAAMRRSVRPMASGQAEVFEDYVSGLAEFVTTVPARVFAPVQDPVRQAVMESANTAAALALNEFAPWIKTSPRNENFALGTQHYADMLWAYELIDTPAGELKRIAEKDLERNLQALQQACAVFAPGLSTPECRARVAAHKPTDGRAAAVKRQVELLKQRILERNIVTIPTDEVVLVAESPPHQRSGTAYISIPGPYEKAVPSIYYISPPDPDWTAEEQQQYLASEADLMTTTAHCVWPGHILETYRTNQSGNPVAAIFYSYAFTEGWTHYVEHMMVHEALDDDPEMAIGQLQNALLGDVRVLSSIGVHTEGMSINESEQMFAALAFSDPANARQEAIRSTYDPGNLFYTMGELMVIKLRDDWLAANPHSSLRDFHDAFLDYGTTPIMLVRKAMLGDNNTGSVFPDD